MNKQFEALHVDLLSAVNGGQNSENVEWSAPGVGPIVSKGGSRSDWGYCADTVKSMGGGVNELIAACGAPPATLPSGPAPAPDATFPPVSSVLPE
jgi:hypothetical protein